MKFLSLFTKTPTHQSFNYLPRYYNPEKERTKEREARIKKELQVEEPAETGHNKSYSLRISGAFSATHKGRTRVKNTPKSSTVPLMRLGIILVLVTLLIAYFTWGEVALYGLLLFVPFYIYLKFRR